MATEFSISSCNFAADRFHTSNWKLGSLRATYAVHLRLILKRVVDFLLVIIELVSLGEALRAKID